jgi:hypothetical protein
MIVRTLRVNTEAASWSTVGVGDFWLVSFSEKVGMIHPLNR